MDLPAARPDLPRRYSRTVTLASWASVIICRSEVYDRMSEPLGRPDASTRKAEKVHDGEMAGRRMQEQAVSLASIVPTGAEQDLISIQRQPLWQRPLFLLFLIATSMALLKALVLAFSAFDIVVAAPSPWGWGGWPSQGQHGNGKSNGINVQLGPRPYYLVNNMDDGPLKDKLESCSEGPFSTSAFSISHRGAPLMFPEHSRQGYIAAMRMGASIIECDVSFTSDRELVCRHSNCDLQYTTNILAHPDLAAKCSEPFVPYNAVNGTPASAKCCTSDITLAEFKTLCAEMEATTFNALNVTETASPDFGRIGTTPDWRTNMYAYSCAEPMSLKEQISLVASMGLNFTAEAKTPQVPSRSRATTHSKTSLNRSSTRSTRWALTRAESGCSLSYPMIYTSGLKKTTGSASKQYILTSGQIPMSTATKKPSTHLPTSHREA